MASPGGGGGGPTVRVGDWMCSACGNHHFASRENCNKCGAPKASSGQAATPRGSGPGAMRPGDWICPACSNHNFASREACNKCGAAKPEGAGGEYGAAPSA